MKKKLEKIKILCVFPLLFLALQKSNTTLVGPSPASGSWMHRVEEEHALWRVRRSASVAGGVVGGGLHVFLCKNAKKKYLKMTLVFFLFVASVELS